jgi:hypothetical protein
MHDLIHSFIHSLKMDPGSRGKIKFEVTHASAMGTIARPWYASIRNAREDTREYA